MCTAVYEGVVTQSGTLFDGHTYRAKQHLRMEVHRTQSVVKCDIIRAESRKYVDRFTKASPSLPRYLNEYLSAFGSCLEQVRGVWCWDEQLVCLETSAPPKMLAPSPVQWSPHSYYLIIQDEGARLTGVAINRDNPTDRENEIGRVRLRRVK